MSFNLGQPAGWFFRFQPFTFSSGYSKLGARYFIPPAGGM